MLGAAAAEYIAQPGVVRNRDWVGLGSGRGVSETVEAMIADARLIPNQEVTLVSMSANNFPLGVADSSRSRYLDADTNVNTMSRVFQNGVRALTVSQPITASDAVVSDPEEPLPKGFVETRGLEDWVSARLDLALVGLGVLAGGHRWIREVENRAKGKSQQVQREPRLNALFPKLARLVELCRTIGERSQSEFIPVADFANRLFIVRPGPAHKSHVTATEASEVARLVDHLNCRLVTFRKRQLLESKSVILVAGSKLKQWALFDVLRAPEYSKKIHVLVTDLETANRLVEWQSEYS
jgi:hypothetical protein